ncbi:SurA N-terminal domain-containing protein [Candidatus Dojkabacteria bacterium]|nr:SurA N-terminal domain-containing protein [Candidatus Dojkabacteria bacterium]
MARTKKSTTTKTKSMPKKSTAKSPKKTVKKSTTKPKVTKAKKVEKVVKKKIEVKNIVDNPVVRLITKVVVFVIVIIGVLTLADLGVQYLNNSYSVAVVNGKRISKHKWHDLLEKYYGSSIAQTLINDEIIKQESKKAKVTVSKEDIQKELDSIIQRIGGQEAYEAALTASNITEEEIKDQIEVQALYDKVIGPSITYTEEELKAFFDQYGTMLFPTEAAALKEGEKLDYEKYKDETKARFITTKVQEKQAEWLSGMKEEYVVQDNSIEKPKYGFLTIIRNLLTKKK